MTQTPPVAGRSKPEQDLLDEIRRRTPLPHDVTPERALSAVTCALDQHVTGGESRHLFESLPHEVQPLLAPCLLHRGEPAARFGWEGLVRRVAEHLGVPHDQAENVVPGVMAVLSSRLPEAEFEHVASQLPEELKQLWVGPRETPPLDPREVVEEVERRVALPPGVTGEGAIAAVMCTLGEDLPLGEARRLFESLPDTVRPSLGPCLQNRREGPFVFVDRAEFFAQVAERLPAKDVEPIVRAVFHAVQHYLPHDAVHRVHTHLPSDLERLWREP